MKKIIPLLLLLLVLVPRVYAAPEGVEGDRGSVVHVYGMGTNSDTGQRLRWTGTAFAVGVVGEKSDVFLTNWHVASGSGKCDPDSIRLWILKDGAQLDSSQVPLEDGAVECTVLLTTDGYPDVAVLRSESQLPGCTALPLISSRHVADGTPVYALGFAGLSGTHYGADSGPEDVTVTEGAISDRLIMTSAGNTRSIIHTAAIQHGFSGGPLVDASGAVVAQNTYGFEEAVTTELFCAVYTDYAMELLDRLNIPYTTLPGEPAAVVLVKNLLHRPDLPHAAAYGIFALGAAAIGVFIWYFIRTAKEVILEYRQKRSNQEKEVQ